jgi:hypothetical protein
LIHEAMRRPFGIEGRRFVGDPYVLDEGRDDLLVPQAIDEFSQARLIHVPGVPSLKAGAMFHRQPTAVNDAGTS